MIEHIDNEKEKNAILTNVFGDKPPKLTASEKRDHREWKKQMSEAERKQYDDDQEEAKSMIALRYINDDEDYKPYYEGKWKAKKKGDRDSTNLKTLNKLWLLDHFAETYIDAVTHVGRSKVLDPNRENTYLPLAKNKRWLPVPMGNKTKDVPLETKFLCQSIPIRYPQGDVNSCLISAVASAFSYIEHARIAEHLIANKMECVDKDSNEQWIRLVTLLNQSDIIDKMMCCKWYNRSQGKQRGMKFTLDVEKLTRDHDDAMDVHAVCLVGADGSQDHAVAIVNGLIFDSCATHAMSLDRPPLDWCCNCKGGYKKTGQALRIRMTQRKVKKSHRVMKPAKCIL